MTLVYVTSNENKREEVEILRSQLCLDDGRPIRELFDFDIRPNSIDERLAWIIHDGLKTVNESA